MFILFVCVFLSFLNNYVHYTKALGIKEKLFILCDKRRMQKKKKISNENQSEWRKRERHI